MNQESTANEAEMTLLLDRLVCDELDDAARRRVLDWLEESSERWRLCGLTFLESQTWSKAIDGWPQTAGDERPSTEQVRSTARLELPERKLRPRVSPAGQAAVLAASVLLAFVAGLSLGETGGLARRESARPQAGEPRPAIDRQPGEPGKPREAAAAPVLASVSVQSGLGAMDAATIRIPVMPAGSETAQPAGPSAAIPDYVRRQWERRGYRLTVERRYLFANLPDGEQVVVPVDQVQLNRVAPKIY